ncbi:MAG: hypothetical protein ACM3ML_26850 [Micromonosporaceae bacterium]
MSTRRRSPLNRQTAEQLLRGQPAGTPTGGPVGTDALAGLLAAAAAPARSHELAGKKEALAAFRAARLSPATQLRRRPMIGTSIARVLTLKVAAAAAALAAGGVALAAGTGHLPTHLGPATPAAHTSSASTPSPSHHRGSTATPSASLYGLCHAYTAGAGANPGKALQNPAFAGLIAAAGGKDNVQAFCAGVLKAGPGHSANAHQRGTPSSHPKGKPSTHPAGQPPSHPTGKPSSLPSVVPTSLPTVVPTNH